MVRHRIGHKEIAEAEEIAREEALNRIAALSRRFDLTLDDLAGIFRNPQDTKDANGYLRTPEAQASPTRLFDPFFDGW